MWPWGGSPAPSNSQVGPTLNKISDNALSCLRGWLDLSRPDEATVRESRPEALVRAQLQQGRVAMLTSGHGGPRVG
jgi:hypothetical protein